MDCHQTYILFGKFGIFTLKNDRNDMLYIMFCQVTECFSISLEGNTVVLPFHYCCLHADLNFVNAEKKIHQSVGFYNN